MGTGALKLVGSSWSLRLNVETGVAVATIKPRCSGTVQKWLAVGQTGLHTAKAHGHRGLPGVCRCESLLQSGPGQVCGGSPLHVKQQGSGGRSQPVGGGCVFLGPPSRANCFPLEDWVVPAHVGSAVLSTAQCFLLEGATCCCDRRRGLCERVPCGSPKRRFNFSYEYCSVE